MEKRFRKLGKSLSPSGFGLGSKAPPSKRTRSQTKNSSAASGLTTPQQTVVPQSGSEPSGNFHGIPGTGGSPTAKLDNINIGQLEDNLKPTNNTRASFSREKANSDSFLFTSGNFGKQSEPRVHPVKAIDKGDSEGESVKKELQESQNILRSLELQHHKRQLQETREKIENMKLKMGGHPRDESNHIKWEPRANVNWPPRNEVFPGNNAPMASTNELSHYADVASQNSTSKQVRFDSNVGNNVNSAQTPNPFYPPRDQTESRWHAVSSNKIAELKNSLKNQEPRASVNWPPRNEVFSGNNAPTANTNELPHYFDGVPQSNASHRVHFNNNVETWDNPQPSHAIYPQRDQSQSQWHMMTSKIAEIKSTLKIDKQNDPRDEVRFFEDTCKVNEIFDHNVMYKILTAVWPPADIKNYWAVTKENERGYLSLKAFLSEKNGKLSKIFRSKPDWSTVSFMELAIEAKKFHAELMKGDNAMKFAFLYLAPDHLKSKIRELVGRDIEKFESRCRDICDASDQRSQEEARNVNYWSNKNQNKASYRNKKGNSQQFNQNSNNYGNYGNYGNHTSSYQGNNMNTNYNAWPNTYQNNFANNAGGVNFNNPFANGFQNNNMANNNNPGNGRICPNHLKYKERCRTCNWPDRCEMAHVLAPKPQKNGLPSSSQ